ncbi:MAG: SDR family NAD(P)-dependent oxidoreductase, partial [Moraxellaceae bacterium]
MTNNVAQYPTAAPAQEQSHQPGDQDAMYPAPEIIKTSHQGSGKLNGKVALISGGDSGIGRSTAVLFAREGADVAIIYLDESDDAAQTQKLVELEGRRCLSIQQDVGDSNGIKHAVEQVIQQFGKINILVNNAGVQYPQKDLTDIDDE